MCLSRNRPRSRHYQFRLVKSLSWLEINETSLGFFKKNWKLIYKFESNQKEYLWNMMTIFVKINDSFSIQQNFTTGFGTYMTSRNKNKLIMIYRLSGNIKKRCCLLENWIKHFHVRPPSIHNRTKYRKVENI